MEINISDERVWYTAESVTRVTIAVTPGEASVAAYTRISHRIAMIHLISRSGAEGEEPFLLCVFCRSIMTELEFSFESLEIESDGGFLTLRDEGGRELMQFRSCRLICRRDISKWFPAYLVPDAPKIGQNFLPDRSPS